MTLTGKTTLYVNSGDRDRDIVTLLSEGIIDPSYFKKLRLWNWRYNHNPALSNDIQGLILEDRENRIVGHSGIVATTASYLGIQLKTCWINDVYLAPSLRSSGLGTNLIKEITHYNSLTLVFGVSPMLAPILKKQGYHRNLEVEQFFLSRPTLHLRTLLKVGLQVTQKAIHNGFINGKQNAHSFTVTISNTLPENYTALFQNHSLHHLKQIERNTAYMKWKYCDHPTHNYQFFNCYENNILVAMMVTRSGKKMARIVDFVGPVNNYQLFQTLINVFLDDTKNEKLLECTTSCKALKLQLRKNGFRAYHDKPLFFIHSTLKNDAHPEKHWFIMGGDSDNDI